MEQSNRPLRVQPRVPRLRDCGGERSPPVAPHAALLGFGVSGLPRCWCAPFTAPWWGGVALGVAATHVASDGVAINVARLVWRVEGARWGYGITGLEGADAGPVPAASVALTSNV